MTLAEATEIVASWEDRPAAFISLLKIEAMVGALLGVRRHDRKSATQPTELAAWQQRLGAGDVHAGMPESVVLDFATLKARDVG
jgi:hypothetical protein